MNKKQTQEMAAFFVGMLVGGFFTYSFLIDTTPEVVVSEDYHIHADFIVQTGETVHSYGTAEFMSTAEHILHPDAHLHDEDGEVLHMHEENISFAEFLDSLGIKTTDGCIALPNDDTYCAVEGASWSLFVNDQLWAGDFTTYVPQDLDRILLYYGQPENASIQTYLDAVTDNACFYSGSCPERGVAPAESCGLTCEL